MSLKRILEEFGRTDLMPVILRSRFPNKDGIYINVWWVWLSVFVANLNDEARERPVIYKLYIRLLQQFLRTQCSVLRCSRHDRNTRITQLVDFVVLDGTYPFPSLLGMRRCKTTFFLRLPIVNRFARAGGGERGSASRSIPTTAHREKMTW